MIRPIKFRARDAETGNLVYGSLVDYGAESYRFRYWINPIDGERNYPADEDSIAQLIGYDLDGHEVYEGDEVVYILNGETVKADMCAIHNCHQVYRLKEAAQ